MASALTATPASRFEVEGKPAPKPLFRDPIYDGAADPVLVWDRTGKKWLMFYTNRRANVPKLSNVEWVHATRIGIAASDDGGATWRYKATAEIPYGKADYTHWAPEIIFDRDVYHMYLSIVPGTFQDWNAPREIVHLTSKDLKKWNYQSTLRLNSDRVIDPTVIQLPDMSWRMWFKNERGEGGSIYYADSADLYHWTSKGVALLGSQGEGPKAFQWEGRYWLVIDAWKGFAVYRSNDCLNWKGQEDRLLEQPGTLPTDRTKGNHADVVVSEGRAYLFYFTHQVGQDAEGKGADWHKHTVIQVAELKEKDGVLSCDRNAPVHIRLAMVVS